ncbi:MAG: HAD-IIA family hydrolase [Culicoidibacterales bacterium]
MMNRKIDAYKLYLFDLDGTVYSGSRPIKSCITFINKLLAANKEVVFITNNATVLVTEVSQKLTAMGITAVRKTKIITVSMAMASEMKQRKITRAYIIGQDALQEQLKQENVIQTEENCQAVIVGLNKNVAYQQLAKAAQILQQQENCVLFATNTDLRLPQNDFFLPGAGTIVYAIEAAANKKAIVIGKPSAVMVRLVAAFSPNIEKKDWLMVGDNYHTDIMFGINNSIDTCFVQTGVHDSNFVNQQAVAPTFMLEHL